MLALLFNVFSILFFLSANRATCFLFFYVSFILNVSIPLSTLTNTYRQMQSVYVLYSVNCVALILFSLHKKKNWLNETARVYLTKRHVLIYVSYTDNINRKTHLGIVFVLFTLYTYICFITWMKIRSWITFGYLDLSNFISLFSF